MNHEEHIALLETIIAGLVYAAAKALGDNPYEQEVRIPRWAVEEPPDIEEDDDPFNGDWIYRLTKRGEES